MLAGAAQLDAFDQALQLVQGDGLLGLSTRGHHKPALFRALAPDHVAVAIEKQHLLHLLVPAVHEHIQVAVAGISLKELAHQGS